MAELETFPLTLKDVFDFFQPNRLFNLEIIGDIVLNKQIPTYSPVFTTPQMSRYIKYLMIEGGLNGMFQFKSPKEYIEGFTDPLVF